MKIFILFFLFFNKIFTKVVKENKEIEKKKIFNLKYKFINEQNIDLSGLSNILPKETELINDGELAYYVENILSNKISITNIEIFFINDNSKEIIITFGKEKEEIYEIKMDPYSEDMLKKHQEQQKINIPLQSKIPFYNDKISAILNLSTLMNKKSGNINYIPHIYQKGSILYTENFHKDINIKYIQNIQFIFVQKDINKTNYILSIKDLSIPSLKQSLVIESDNLLWQIVNFFFNMHPLKIIERNGQELKKYIKKEGYNQSDLLNIKYIENNNGGFDAYVYIYLGKKLPILNITFSFEKENIKLLQAFSLIQDKLIKDKNILDLNYVPYEIINIVNNIIKEPLQIDKTINEISVPKEGYNINFHIKSQNNDYFIEDIFFEGKVPDNIFDLSKKFASKIGKKFSESDIDEDEKHLAYLLNEKVKHKIIDGSNFYSKKIIIEIGEEFNMESFIKNNLPGISFSLNNFNISKNFDVNIPVGNFQWPLKLIISLFVDQTIKRFNLEGKFQLPIHDIITYLLNKKENNNLNFMLSGSFNYKIFNAFSSWKEFKQNFYKRNLGFILVNNNYKNYKDWYYETKLNIFYGITPDNIEKIFTKKNFKLNGYYYKYNIAFGRQNIFKTQDNIDMNVTFSDKIFSENNLKDNLKIIMNNDFLLNFSINYSSNFIEKIFLQNNIQYLWGKNKENIKINSIDIIGKKEISNFGYYSIHEKWIIHNMLVLNYKIQSIDTILGQNIVLLIGFFSSSIFYNGDFLENYRNGLFYEMYNGIIITIKLGIGSFNLYIPLSIFRIHNHWNDNFIKKNQRYLDFSIQSTIQESFKKNPSINIYQPNYLIDNLI